MPPVKNPERNAEIVRRRQAGEWPTEIAKAMGLSRNAVIGVCYRAGLSSPDTDTTIACRLMTPRGEAAPNVILTESEVRAIRQEYAPWSGDNGAAALARRYGVAPSTVQGIVYRRSWRHVA